MFGLSGHSCLFDVNVTIINCAICIYLCIIKIHRNHCLVFYTDTHKSYDVNIFIQFYNQYALKYIYIYMNLFQILIFLFEIFNSLQKKKLSFKTLLFSNQKITCTFFFFGEEIVSIFGSCF